MVSSIMEAEEEEGADLVDSEDLEVEEEEGEEEGVSIISNQD